MPLVCAACGRQAVMKSAHCAFCGGQLVAGGGRPPAPPAPLAPPPQAKPATPPVVRPPGAAEGPTPSYTAATGVVPPGLPAPNSPPSAYLPFPTAARPPLGPGRPLGKPSGPSVEELYPDPPLWQQILNIPVATAGRRIVLSIAVFIGVAIWGINRFIGRHQPAENKPGGIALYPGGQPPAMPALPPPGAVDPETVRNDKANRSEGALRQIGQGLDSYAKRYGAFPDRLTDELSELSDFGDFRGALAVFEGGKLSSYSRTLSPDLTEEVAVIEARMKGSGAPVRQEIRYRRRRA